MLEDDLAVAERAASELSHVLVIRGRGTDQALLEEEEIDQVSTFVALTDDHESNLVAGLLAKRLGAGRSIVLVDNPAMVSMVGDMGMDAIISPRLLTIGQMIQHIRGGGVRSGAALLGDEVEIVEVEVEEGCLLVSGPLMEVKLPQGILVVALQRGEGLMVPRGPDRVLAGDRVLIAVESRKSLELEKFTEV